MWQRRNPGLLNVTLGRTAGKIERGWGRLEGQAYQCVCEDRGTTAGWSDPKRGDTPNSSYGCLAASLSHSHTRIMSGSTAEKARGVWIFNETPPLSSSNQICSLARESNAGGRRKSRARLQI